MIHYAKDTENIVTLTLDMQGRKENIINHEIVDAFVPVLEHLKSEKAKGALKGVIITSTKKTFLAGGDLEYLYHARNPEQIFTFTEKLKRFFRDLERPGVPVVAALNGAALGTGFELALACHHRIALNKPDIKVGFPEVKFGLMPGNGGVIRLLWLLGIEKAFPILTLGHRFSVAEAKAAGLIDDLAGDEHELMEKAKNWLRSTTEGRKSWDSPAGKIPGGTSREQPVRLLMSRLAAETFSRYHDNYPAPKAILNTLNEGSLVDFDTALRIESRYYTSLLSSEVCKNMIHTFWFDKNSIYAGLSRAKGFGKFRPRRIGIVGAGLMGSGIAFSCAFNGMEVVLKDVSKMVAERGKEYAAGRLEEMKAEKQIAAEEATRILTKIKTTENAAEFKNCDLVVEAVFEHPSVKIKVMRETEEHLDEYAFLGTNTISIPITKLAESSGRPENYAGLHFFVPADKVPLVEIVRGAKTSDETIAKAFDFVRAIRKIPIVVKDDWGFYVMRVQNTYILEGITLLQEGYPAALIENIGKQIGMPQSPLALADELGLKMVLEYEKQAAAHYGAKYVQHPAVESLLRMLEQHNRSGKSKKAGFYNYDDEEGSRLWEELDAHFSSRKIDNAAREAADRLLFAQVIEAVWCLQEGVIRSVEEANLGSIFGWGFPSYLGGVIRFIHYFGKEKFKAKCAVLQEKFGPRFKTPKLFEQL